MKQLNLQKNVKQNYKYGRKKDGYAYKHSDVPILMHSPDGKYVTPVSEAMQAVIWHALVSHPILQKKNKMVNNSHKFFFKFKK